MSNEPRQIKIHLAIAILTTVMIALHLFFRFGFQSSSALYLAPLFAALTLGGIPLLGEIALKILKRDFGADLLAGITIAASIILKEYLAGSIIVLMMSGGHALENFAVQNASSVLKALAKRMPSVAHRRENEQVTEISLSDISPGNTLVVFPHEICPVDGVVLEGHGSMDEAYLTGEPFQIEKAPGSLVISGAVNGNTALTIQASKRSADSRYAKIVEVIRASEKNKPQIRRLGDQIGAIYAPIALGIAAFAWAMSGNPMRFLAVLVVATPCPLLIGIPVAIIGSISLAARRGIIIKNPGVLEEIDHCRTAIFDKTGTLTYGEPCLSECLCAPGHTEKEVLGFAASVERYSKHPLGFAIKDAAQKKGFPISEAAEVHEIPGEGLKGVVASHSIQIIGRNSLVKKNISGANDLPKSQGGLECAVVIDNIYAALLRFRDTPRVEGKSFIDHLGPRHRFERSMIISGDRESEVRYLAKLVGIREIHAEKSPEEKVTIVRGETKKSKTLYVGDGINDAPALLSATVGIAIGRNSDITSESAGAVVMDSSLTKVDELMHIGRRMRVIALQSAIGGILLSAIGMFLAASGHLTPVAGALAQEAIDVLAILNALRAAAPPRYLSDF